MPFRQIPYATEDSEFMAVTSTDVKINMQTNQPATDRTTGEVLKTVGLLEMRNGAADVLKVTVPASQIPDDLAVGTPVRARSAWSPFRGSSPAATASCPRASPTAPLPSNAPPPPPRPRLPCPRPPRSRRLRP